MKSLFQRDAVDEVMRRIEQLQPASQREWGKMVHPAAVAPTDDPARAARRIMTDDGFNIGVLYAGSRAPYKALTAPPADMAAIEKEFAL